MEHSYAIEMSRGGVASLLEALHEDGECLTNAILVMALSFAHTTSVLNKAADSDVDKKLIREKAKVGVASIIMMLKANGIDIGVEPIDLSDIDGGTQTFVLYHDGKEVHSVN